MEKAILLVKQDEEAARAFAALTELKKTAVERMKFLEKQRDNVIGLIQKEHTNFWRDFEKSLEERGLMPPEYNRITHAIGFDEAGSAVYIRDKQAEKSPSDHLREALKSLFE